jgi:uncharacterized membrane protein YfcA
MLALLGVAGGVLSGLLGLGGGVLLVPCLVYLFGFSQKMAQGTTLALMIPPIGLWAAINYYKQGYVDLKVAGLLCVGFILGTGLGSSLALSLPTDVLKKVFGVAIVLIGLKMLFSR